MNTSTSAKGSMSLAELRTALRQFASDREWEQFHSPKNLAIALSVEASELLEHFQWTADAASAALTDERRTKIRAEVADVLLYLIILADKLDIDLLAAATEKIQVNAMRYPVEKARGSSKKYTEL
jgi:NTP pyrophosphatase (non-canonical NTP hydrolase)